MILIYYLNTFDKKIHIEIILLLKSKNLIQSFITILDTPNMMNILPKAQSIFNYSL
jgi:hypothetical protein